MIPYVMFLAFALHPAAPVAPEVGTASGHGTIDRNGENAAHEPISEKEPFAPQHAYAYSEGAGAKKMTWIVLTEKQPPVAAWTSAKDRADARRAWCEKEKAAFVAVKLNASWGVEWLDSCPAKGGFNTEMVSTINGLDSVVVTLTQKDGGRLKGTLRSGEGTCGSDEKPVYCTPKSDYTFDTPVSH